MSNSTFLETNTPACTKLFILPPVIILRLLHVFLLTHKHPSLWPCKSVTGFLTKWVHNVEGCITHSWCWKGKFSTMDSDPSPPMNGHSKLGARIYNQIKSCSWHIICDLSPCSCPGCAMHSGKYLTVQPQWIFVSRATWQFHFRWNPQTWTWTWKRKN